MSETDVTSLCKQYKGRGVLLDTNLLLLYLLGNFDYRLISRHKRLAEFEGSDFEFLVQVVRCFPCVMVTPNILTEVSNLAAQMDRVTTEQLCNALPEQLSMLAEQYIVSATAMENAHLRRLGVTDAGIGTLCKGNVLVFTTDLHLWVALQSIGADTINYNHIRSHGWKL